MGTTEHLKLHVWGESENSGNWLDMRLALAGPGAESNMMILDAWAKAMEEAVANIQPSLTFDEIPTDGSTNPVTSGGVYTALAGKQAAITASGILKGAGNGAVSAAVAGEDYVTLQQLAAKQEQISVSGLLKGDGTGGVSAAVAGTDFAEAAHTHDGRYYTETEVDTKLAGKAPSYSPVSTATFTSWSPEADPNTTYKLRWITASDQGKCLLMYVAEAGHLCLPSDTQENLPIGFECEVIQYLGPYTLRICSFHLGTGDSSIVRVKGKSGNNTAILSEQFGVAVIKKVAANTWIVGGDVTCA